MTTEVRCVLCNLINQMVQQEYSYVSINLDGDIVPFKKYVTYIKCFKYPGCKGKECEIMNNGKQVYTEPI